jgi:quinol monooxygenase YgiN
METLILTFPCKPGAGAGLLEELKTALIDTRAFNGCLSVLTYTSASNPDDIILIEDWDERASQVAYMQWRAETGMREHLAPILAGLLKEEWLISHEI